MGRNGISKSPEFPVTVERSKLVERFRAVIFASGRTAPDGSVTRPTIVAVDWAHSETMQVRNRRDRTKCCIRFLIFTMAFGAGRTPELSYSRIGDGVSGTFSRLNEKWRGGSLPGDHNSSLLSRISNLNCQPSKEINIRPNSSQSIQPRTTW